MDKKLLQTKSFEEMGMIKEEQDKNNRAQIQSQEQASSNKLNLTFVTESMSVEQMQAA